MKTTNKSKTVAFVDPASFSLPYDVFRVRELAKTCGSIDFYCSTSRYNEEYLFSLSGSKGISIKKFRIASPVNRLLGLFNYTLLLINLFLNRKKYDEIHFQWSVFFPLELLFFLLLRRRLYFTFHNDIPHDYKKDSSRVNRYIAKVSKRILFVSKFTYQRFLMRYGKSYESKSEVNTHPLIPLVNGDGEAMLPLELSSLGKRYNNRLIFWGNVKPYKGVDSLLRLNDENLKRFRPLVLGKWDKSLYSLKNDLLSRGVEVVDEFIGLEELIKYFSGNNLFILPYSEATQSGVLYTLLYYKCKVISSNVGDIADYMKSNRMTHLIFETDEDMNKILIQFKGF